MVKKKTAGPRLKICQKCEDPNPPRQFYCKSCNHPFYTEEYFASRPGVLPRQNAATVEETSEFMKPIIQADHYIVDKQTLKNSLYSEIEKPVMKKNNENLVGNREIEIFFDKDVSTLFLDAGTSCLVQPGQHILFTGDASGAVESVSLQDDLLALLVGGEKIQFWSISSKIGPKLIAQISDCSPHVSQIKWVSQSSVPGEVSGLLLVVSLDRIDLLLIPNFSAEKNEFISISFRDSLVWSSASIPEPYYPAKADGRISPDGSEVQIVAVNNTSSFSHFFSLDSRFSLKQMKVFGCNVPTRRVGDESSATSGTGMCVCFISDDRFKFVVGLTTGLMVMYDLRDVQGPLMISQGLAGQRRWFREISSLGSDLFLTAFQAGCVVSNFSDDPVITPIGGDVRSAQCMGIGAIGNQVFSAMNSGAVIHVDHTLREKIRRGMTRYLSLWGTLPQPAELETATISKSVEEEMFEKLSKKILHSKFFLKLFPEKTITKSLKYLKASDGASNEQAVPPEFGSDENIRAARISCLTTDGDRKLVAYGLEGGLVHLAFF